VLPIPGGNEVISNVRIKPGGDLFKEAVKLVPSVTIRVWDDGEIDTIGAIKDNPAKPRNKNCSAAQKQKRVISAICSRFN